jgi:hypothetical protein
MVETLRRNMLHVLMDELSTLMFKIHHPDSGRLIEAVMQVLPDDKFVALAALVIGNEDDELVQSFAAHMVLRIASKLEYRIESPEMFIRGAKNFLFLIHCESLRRKGHMEFIWPESIFTAKDHHEYTGLTAAGMEVAQLQFLEMYDSKKVQ